MASKLDTLTHQQLQVVHHLLKGHNIFLTGGGGVGKSYLLSVIYNELPALKKQFDSLQSPYSVPKLPRIQITAMTGCAALLLGNKAKTLHSWSGIKLGKGTVNELFVRIRRSPKSMRHWLCTDLLIIDEVSMLTAELLDKLNQLAKKLRSNQKPFGGIQVMFVGDFYQLPPVNKTDEKTIFAFESDAWKEIIHTSIELTIIQRQKDEIFQKVLTEARFGNLSKESCKILRERQGLEWRQNKIRPTLLFPRRAEVDMINESNLRALQGKRYHYKAKLLYDGLIPENFNETDENFVRALKQYDNDAPYTLELELAMDTQVMLIANMDMNLGLVNGSRGVVVGFCPATELPIVEFVNGIIKTIGNHSWPIEEYEFISRSQVPLRLAYACTIHKGQGSSLDSALVDIGSGNFEFGQAYVALSRCRSLEALYVYDFDPVSFRAHPKVKQFYENLILLPLSEQDQLCIKSSKDLLIKEASDPNTKQIVSSVSEEVRAINIIKTDQEEMDEKELKDQPGQVQPSTNWLYDSIPSHWKSYLSKCETKLNVLSEQLVNSKKEFFPSKDNIWSALDFTPLDSIKVVILGQDPYPTPGNAHGLAFSVLPDVKPLPASLKNIYKEIQSDLNMSSSTNGYLESWARQGILLLNTVLTVESGQPQSHSKMGWEEITDEILKIILEHTRQTIFVLWGKSAQSKKKLIDSYYKHQHRTFESAHPSPLSASKGFFGSKPFSTINNWLIESNKSIIEW
jgi:ATP-dependent DNA helicase PIF1